MSTPVFEPHICLSAQEPTAIRERPRATSVSQCFSCDFPQEGALDLLKKLNSCQMSIQLLQVGGGALEVVALWEGKTPWRFWGVLLGVRCQHGVEGAESVS